MAEGRHILYVTCLACGHVGRMDADAARGLWGRDLWGRLRCTGCGVLGQVETRLSWQLDRLDIFGPREVATD